MTQPLLASVRHGSPKHTASERLESLGWDVDAKGCWNIRLAFSSTHGYGVTTFAGKSITAHRLAHEAWLGPIPPRSVVRHSCDNRRCINPAHLDSGTHSDNTQDMLKRGRNRRKLGEQEVAQIRRESHRTATELALELGVSVSAVCRARKGQTWGWLK